MKKTDPAPLLRIPVRCVDGVWECNYGGPVPVKKDSPGELIIERSAISDPFFLATMEEPDRFRILEQGTELLVALSVKTPEQIPDGLTSHLRPMESVAPALAVNFNQRWHSGTTHFAPIWIGQPDERQAVKLETQSGGLWLLTKGPKPKGLTSTQIRLPEGIEPDTVRSLNHAFTVLSETYETSRISHTGSIYERVLYKETNNRWYPLEVLRDEALAENDTQIANSLWCTFMKRMSRNETAGKAD